MIDVFCTTCGAELRRHLYQFRKTKNFYCNFKCFGNSPKKKPRVAEDINGTFLCRKCQRILPGVNFRWQDHVLKNSIKSYRSNCFECLAKTKAAWDLKHQQDQAEKHIQYQSKKFVTSDEKGGLLFLFKRRMASYRRRAKLKGFDCNVTPEFLLELWEKQEGKCYYTGVSIEWNNFGIGKGRRNLKGISLDRVNNTKGYTQDNVVLCTWIANTLKNDMPLEEFYNSCSLILLNRKDN